jgi:hypothetical protein
MMGMEMLELQKLMMKMMPKPPRIPVAMKIGALLLVPPLDSFWM